MQKHDLKTWRPEILDNGMRVRICYEGSGVLLPLIDFRGLIDIKECSDKLLENANKQNEIIKKILKENNRLTELAEIRREAEKATYYGENRRRGTGCRGDAEIVAMAVRGAKLKDIQGSRFTYDKQGHKRKFARSKIFNALSVSKPEDYARVQRLYREYPTVFKGITDEQINNWFNARYAKLNKREG